MARLSLVTLVFALSSQLPGPTAQEPAAIAPEATPDERVAEARDLVRAGSYAEAAALLREIVGDDSEDAGLLALYGEVLVATGDVEQAVPILERAIAADPGRKRLHFQLATANTKLGEVDGALAAYAAEIELNDDPEIRFMARLNRSILLRQRKDWAGAAAEIEEALLLRQDRPEIHGDLATLYLDAGDPAKAATALDRGAAAGFKSAQLYFNVGARHYNAKAYAEAEGAFLKALEIDPAMAQVERSLGSTLAQLGRPKEAAEHYARYLKLRPDAPDAEEIRKRMANSGS